MIALFKLLGSSFRCFHFQSAIVLAEPWLRWFPLSNFKCSLRIGTPHLEMPHDLLFISSSSHGCYQFSVSIFLQLFELTVRSMNLMFNKCSFGNSSILFIESATAFLLMMKHNIYTQKKFVGVMDWISRWKEIKINKFEKPYHTFFAIPPLSLPEVDFTTLTQYIYNPPEIYRSFYENEQFSCHHYFLLSLW